MANIIKLSSASTYSKIAGGTLIFGIISLFFDFFAHVILGVGGASCFLGATATFPIIGHAVCWLANLLPLAVISAIWYLCAGIFAGKQLARHGWGFKLAGLIEMFPAVSVLPVFSIFAAYLILTEMDILRDIELGDITL